MIHAKISGPWLIHFVALEKNKVVLVRGWSALKRNFGKFRIWVLSPVNQ